MESAEGQDKQDDSEPVYVEPPIDPIIREHATDEDLFLVKVIIIIK